MNQDKVIKKLESQIVGNKRKAITLAQLTEELKESEKFFVFMVLDSLKDDSKEVPNISKADRNALICLMYSYGAKEIAEACRIATIQYSDIKTRINKLGGILYNRKLGSLLCERG